MLRLLDARTGRIKLLVSQLQLDEEHLPVGRTLFVSQTVLMLDLSQQNSNLRQRQNFNQK